MYKKLRKVIICAFFACFFSVEQGRCTEIDTLTSPQIELSPEGRSNKSMALELFEETAPGVLSKNTGKNSAGIQKPQKLAEIAGWDIPYVKTQPDFEITRKDIENAIPTQADVILSKKNEHDIKVMETRHFEKVNNYDSAKYRVAKLENYLLGRTWEFSPIEDRMRRLRLASQRKMLSGTSLPPGIRRYVSPARIANDSAPLYENEDNVGLIDGLMRLYAPDVYKNWSVRKKRLQERYYNDG